MRLLVYCGTRKAIERFDMDPDWEIAVPAYKERLTDIIKKFQDNPNAKLAVQGNFMIHGWRAPADTVVLFDKSWPYALDSGESIQAAARVEYSDQIGVR
jgi:hypothetical protein